MNTFQPLKIIEYKDGLKEDLNPQGGIADQVHLFEQREVQAVNAALAAGRPLLVRGEPGTGKSQLARAAAKNLGRAYIQQVIDSQTESRDLLWQLDSLQRLAEAQLAGALRDQNADIVRTKLKIENFVRPGPLWWAFNWPHALNHIEKIKQHTNNPQSPPPQPDGGDYKKGCVVLIDEIDKAESEVPNGLLEALGAGQFTPLGQSEPVTMEGPAPLVLITSNDERILPNAFLRRCLVLKLELPDKDDELIAKLVQRGKVHFKGTDDNVLDKAAELLARDRASAKSERRPPFPGQAEFLDLLRAVLRLYPENPKRQSEALDELAEYTLRKNADKRTRE